MTPAPAGDARANAVVNAIVNAVAGSRRVSGAPPFCATIPAMKRIVLLVLIMAGAAALAVAVYVATGRTQPDWLRKRFGGD